MSKVFPAKVPDGPVRNITPNGTTRDSGAQSDWSNSYGPRGRLGTENVGDKTRIAPLPEGNRSGEGSNRPWY